MYSGGVDGIFYISNLYGGVHKWGLHFKKVVQFNYLGDCILKRGSHFKKVVQFN